MSVLTDTLNRIRNWQMRQGYETAFQLLPGLSYQEIEEIVKNLPIQLPTEIYELYQWANGSEEEDVWYLPLQKAVAKYLLKIKSYDSDVESEHHSFKWFEIFCDLEAREQGYVVIDENQENCPVIFMDMKEGDYVTRKYISLTSMMLTLVERKEMGVGECEEIGYQIWRKYNSSIVEEALAKLQNNLSLESLHEAGADLQKYKDSRAVEPLIRILQNLIPETIEKEKWMLMRGYAARVLGALDDLRAVEPLINALQDEYYYNRFEAATSLGKLKDERAIQPLLKTLQDENDVVRRTAALMLVYLKAVDPLMQVLNHHNRNVRLEASWALGEIKDNRAIEPVSQLVKDADKEVQKVATRALSQIRKYNY